MDTIYVREKIYIPVRSLVSKESTMEAYTKRFYDEAACRKCEYKPDRHFDICDTCAAYKSRVLLYTFKEIKGKNYIGLPVGDKRKVEDIAGIAFSEFKIRDLRVSTPFDKPVKFTVSLRPHQEKLVSKYLKSSFGLIEAPPRFGKTVCMLYISIKLGVKTLVLASQHEFLQQYIYHIEGNDEKGIPKCTNLPELERKYKKKLYGFPKTDEDYKNFQIFTMTYHQFMEEGRGKNRFKKLWPQIGHVQVDEAHRCAAPVFSKVVGKFPSKFRMGVTGTVDRKDGRQWVIKKVIGPVVARSTIEALTPVVHIHNTRAKFKGKIPGHWVFAMQRLAKNEARNKLIIEQAVADVKAGHSLVIPLTFKKHIADIVKGINELYGKPIAVGYVGGGSEKNKKYRDDILLQVARKKVKVVVGIRSIIQLGLNVPMWSAIYTAIPISNKPNYKQETSRVRTPMEGKKQPIIRLFYDEAMGQSTGCAKNCIAHMKEFKYIFSKDEATKEALAYFATKGRRAGPDEDDEFTAVRASFSEEDLSSSLGRLRAGRR